MPDITPPYSSPQQQVEADMRRIIAEIERLTGLHSRWSGTVVITADLDASGFPRYYGAKEWNCDIVIHQARLNSPGRYSTSIHEAFHSVSEGLVEPDYRAFKRYEEGVVEQCTRILRVEILAAMNLLEPLEARNSYNGEVALLEDLRLRTTKSARDFYLDLLKTPLRDREKTVIQWIQDADTTKTFTQIVQETSNVRMRLKL